MPDYTKKASFGSLELIRNDKNEFIGQEIDYKKSIKVPLLAVDSFKFERVDFMKIDVEGMELSVLEGALKTIKKHKPILTIEFIKSDKEALQAFLKKQGYQSFEMGINFLAIHKSDPCLKHVGQNKPQA